MLVCASCQHDTKPERVSKIFCFTNHIYDFIFGKRNPFHIACTLVQLHLSTILPSSYRYVL